jgi:hypothetical protein
MSTHIAMVFEKKLATFKNAKMAKSANLQKLNEKIYSYSKGYKMSTHIAMVSLQKFALFALLWPDLKKKVAISI